MADVHIWVTDQGTGNGGKEYVFRFRIDHFDAGSENKISYTAHPQATDLEIQKDFINILQGGLIQAALLKGIVPDIDIVNENTGQKTIDNTGKDPWDNWIFGVECYVSFESEKSRDDFQLDGELEADRVTEEWRIRTEFEYEFERNKIIRNDGTFISTLNLYEFDGSVVRSLSEHWSAGIFTELFSNSVVNTQFGTSVNAALEYNFFPYYESHLNEFTIAYYAGYYYYNYLEETIFNQVEEERPGHRLFVQYRLNKSWGGADISLEGFQFINQTDKNRVRFEGDIFIRLVKGISLRLSNQFQLIHDQIYLPKGDASLEDILLQRKALATDFTYEFRIGVAFTFGSVYNNVVNTRL